MAIRLIAIFSVLLGLVTFSGCDSEQMEESNVSEERTVSQEEIDSQNATAVEDTLPAFCLEAEATEGKKCLECKPRDLALTRCFTASEGFNLTSSCDHDDSAEEISCKLEDGSDFVFDLMPGKVEIIYEALPFFTQSIKGLMNSKFGDDVALKSMAEGGMDLLLKHKESIFTGKNLEAPIDEFIVIFKKYKPETSDEVLAGVKATLLVEAEAFKMKAFSGELESGDFVEMAKGYLKQIPGAEEKLLASGALDMDKITEYMAILGNLDSLKDLIK